MLLAFHFDIPTPTVIGLSPVPAYAKQVLYHQVILSSLSVSNHIKLLGWPSPHSVAQVDLEFIILLPISSWDYRYAHQVPLFSVL